MGIDLAFATVQYRNNGQSASAHVPVVLQGPQSSPIQRGDILISINGKTVAAEKNDDFVAMVMLIVAWTPSNTH